VGGQPSLHEPGKPKRLEQSSRSQASLRDRLSSLEPEAERRSRLGVEGSAIQLTARDGPFSFQASAAEIVAE